MVVTTNPLAPDKTLRNEGFAGPDAPVAPTTPKTDPRPDTPPAPQEPVPTPTFTPSEDPGTGPATCPEGSPDEGDGAFETCLLPTGFRGGVSA